MHLTTNHEDLPLTLFHAHRRPVAVVLLLALGACHSLVPLERAPVVDDEARVRLTELGAATMAPILGPGVTGVRGRIVSADSALMRLSVVAVTDRDGIENTWLGEQVTVPRQHIAGYDKRELSPVRSAAVGAGILAGMYMLARAAGGGADGFLAAVGIIRQR